MLRHVVPLFALGLTMACGSDGPALAPPIGGAGGTSTGAGGAATTGNATTGPVATVGSGCDVDGGTAIASSTASTGGGAPSCPGGGHASGTLDGANVDVDVAFTSEFVAQNEGQATVHFCGRGEALLLASGALPDGTTTPVHGFFRLPESAPSDGAWYCAGAGSTANVGTPSKSLTLTSLRKLGRCPGTPIGGAMQGCMSGDKSGCGGKRSYLHADLACGSFDWSDPMRGGGATAGDDGYFETVLVGEAEGAALVLQLDNYQVVGGIVATPDDEGGGVFCVGGGSVTVVDQPALEFDFTLKDVSWLGTCASAAADPGMVSIHTP